MSFKPNSTDIVVQNLACDGSHGISVGSLGQYMGEVDIVENVYVYNISMKNASDGARIKVWPSSYTPFQPSLSGGGGSGYVKNVTYDTFYNEGNDWAIEVTQCYGNKNLTLCNQHPVSELWSRMPQFPWLNFRFTYWIFCKLTPGQSNMILSDITFKNFWGTTSKKNDPQVGTLVCSDPSVSNASCSP